ncbi:flavin reductase (DIM6/NTAB) family NADH-FMN oxidoreductase RutF [Clostridium moniliforme]|uniref:Flavin reductase (DIM6/NTAB) family NADH-FMN oxidoreductase RutF n=1 Tax=Clostridium moniliforme TaxID=39489 RepID=A0ABS4EYG1_9CLOT|nr:flavin reductase family protein [Clostridium moniliforme]MBP1888887.1 flavin reductase (DIM6/NTAB) family NADH-FMN oxidoreductase RutF [Clostridium moniliforme]
MKKESFKGSVVLNPVPVVLISSRNNKGEENVFTVAWAGTVCTRPPMLSISIRPERLSYEYIKESMEFVVNIPHGNMVKKVDFCGVRSGRKINKIKEMNFTMIECDNINASYIEECPINIECKVKQIIPLGSHDMFVAEVLSSHINEDLIDEKGKIHFEKGDLLAYCHGEYYKLPRTSIGSFGYSVMKKKTLKNKISEKKVSDKKIENKKLKSSKPKKKINVNKKKINKKNKKRGK